MMKQNLSNVFSKLLFKIDRLNLRDRLITLVATVFGLLFVWNLLIYTPQVNTLSRITDALNNEHVQTAQLNEKRVAIQRLVADNSIQKLVEKYQALQDEMNQLENRLQHYQRRYIDSKQLANMLHSLLKQINGVTIEGFSNTSSELTDGTLSNDDAVKPSVSTPSATPTKAPADEKIQYKLILKGDYFSVTDYLKKMESSDWQLYWDKMTYSVTAYPEASVIIEFYTLKPADEQSSLVENGS